MTHLTRLSLANRLIAGLVTLAILVFGVIATLSLRQELLPATDVPTAMVSATYPGSSPEVVADEVADPLEQVISGVAGVTAVRSTSSNGMASLTVEWEYGQDSDETVAAIRNAADSIKPTLPTQTEIEVMTGSTDDIPVLALAVASDESLQELARKVQSTVVPAISKVEGVRQVQVAGETESELAVTLDPVKLRKHDLTAQAVTQTIQAQSLIIPAGTSYSENNELAIQVGTVGDSAKTVAAWPIPTADGPVLLGSIATVKVVNIESTSIARADGRPALSLVVLKDTDGDAVRISHAINDQLTDLERSLGPGAKFNTLFDSAPMIEQSIHDLAVEGALGLAFAVITILVFLLSVRSTIITAISIPLSLLIAMIGLWAGDYSLNIFTLAALTVAVGRVVDDSIVVIENIKRRDTGIAPLTPAAIVDSVKEVAGAVTASTLTTVAVFLPVAVVSGVVGELFRPFAITVAIALGASLLVSLTIVPVLAFWFLRSRKKGAVATAADHEENEVTRLQKGYLPLLNWVIRRPVITSILALVIFAGTMASATLLKTDFLGSVDDQTTVQVTQELPVGTRLAVSDAAAQKIEAVIAASPRVKSYLTTVGQGGSNVVGITITLKEEGTVAETVTELEGAFAELTGIGEVSAGSQATSATSTDISVQVTAQDTKSLEQAAERVERMLGQIPGLTKVTSDLAEQRPILQVDVDRKKAAELGFTQSEVGQAISNVLRGAQAGTVTLDGETRDITVRSQNPGASPKQIAAIELPVSQIQQQKATEKAQDDLEEKQDALTDRQEALSDQQKAKAEEAKAEAAEQLDEQADTLADQKRDTRAALADARAKLDELKRNQPPAPRLPDPTQPQIPVTVDVLAAQQAQQAWAQQVAQVSAAISQAESGLEALEEQEDALAESREKSADQERESDEATAEQEELADDQKALGEEQKDLADVRAKPITVADIAKVSEKLAPSTVKQIDGDRAVTVTATPDTADLGAVTATLQTRLAELKDLPAGAEVSLGGASSDQQAAFKQLGLAMLLAIVMVFLIMVGTFRSLVQPLVLLVSIPFAATGAVAGLLITDTPLGVPAMVGLLMLIGIVVTNAIVLIDLINKYRERGDDLHSAVIHGARLRLRPIIMTACATVFALLPMGLGLTGGGAFISRPLAVVVIGGLVSSTVLTLLLVPVLYLLAERRGEKKRLRVLAEADSEAGAAGASEVGAPGLADGTVPSSAVDSRTAVPSSMADADPVAGGSGPATNGTSEGHGNEADDSFWSRDASSEGGGQDPLDGEQTVIRPRRDAES